MRNTRSNIVLTFVALASMFMYSEMLFAQSPSNISAEKDSITSLSKKDASAQLQESKAEREVLEVSFASGVPANKFKQAIPSAGVEITSLQYKWRDHRGGYVIKPSQTLEEALGDFERKHGEFLLRQINSLGSTFGLGIDVEESRNKLLEDFFAQLAIFQENGLTLSGFVVEGSPAKLSRLVEALPEDKSTFQIEEKDKNRLEENSKSANQAQSVNAESAAAVQASGSPYPGVDEQWKFTPSKGRIIYNASSRNLTSYFSWDDVSGFNALHFGYEHDITIFAKQKGDVKFGSQAWFSNLPTQPANADKRSRDPRVYKDDTLGDSAALFTVGTAAATAIKTATLYYTDVPVDVRNDSAGPTTGIVSAQLSSWAGEYDSGNSVPEWQEKLYCAAWGGSGNEYPHCMFSDQHYPILYYYNDSGVFRNFPFDYRVSATYYWDKAYNPPRATPPLNCPQGMYKGEYKNTLTGNFIFARCEGAPLDYDWKAEGPKNGVENDNFNVEWNGQFSFSQGRYRFIATSDDGMRVYVDNSLLIDSWVDHAVREDRAEKTLTGGFHTVRVTYREGGGQAVAKLRWEFLGAANCTATVAADRWKGEYFNNVQLSGSPVMIRDDSDVNGGAFFAHDWGTGSPSATCGVNADNFSVRWSRRQSFDAGRYRFTLRADDGVRLYVDNVLKLDRWFDQPPTNQSVDVDLSAGQHDLRVQYYDHGAGAVAQIYWERLGGNVIPKIGPYSWNTTPRANQPFSGLASGTNLVAGATQLFFCQTGTNTCFQHPAAGAIANNSTMLTVSNVNLTAGSWQMYVQTWAGVSTRSASFTVLAQLPTFGNYNWNTTPRANQPFSGSASGTNLVPAATQLFFCQSGTNTCFQHPAAGVTANNATTLTISNVNLSAGSWQMYVQTSAGASGRSAAFTVQGGPPTLTGYSWNTSPRANQSFSGTASGTNFNSGGTQLFFCLSGTNTCYQHPSSGVTVNNSSSLTISNVNLGSGAWQMYVQTSAGQSARSASFAVLLPGPTLSGYSWNTFPRANQLFSGTASGTNFVPGGTQLFFCLSGTNTCYQHPSAGVSVTGFTSLTISNVNLGSGAWQIYVQTSAGQSARSASFAVTLAPSTISGFSWNSTPRPNQLFSGSVWGSNFQAGATQLFFCLSNTNTCYQQPSVGITVISTANMSVRNVNLGAGTWQMFVQTSAGQSARSGTFSVR